jgi:hypothetical protein
LRACREELVSEQRDWNVQILTLALLAFDVFSCHSCGCLQVNWMSSRNCGVQKKSRRTEL